MRRLSMLSIVFVFALLASFSSLGMAADSSAPALPHHFKAELSGAEVPPVSTPATGEASFDLVAPGMSGKGPGGGPGTSKNLGQIGDPGYYTGVIDRAGSGKTGGSGTGGSAAGGKAGRDELRYQLTVKNIENVTAAHLHMGKPTTAEGPVIAPLFLGPKRTGEFSGTLAKGNISDKDLRGPLSGKTVDDLVKMIDDGNVYVNVHTETHPAGEIRGEVREAS